MKMIIRSNNDVEDFLRYECDLGYLLDYLERRKTNSGFYWLPVLDVLRQFPDFNKGVNKIREELGIYPEENVRQLEELTEKRNLVDDLKLISRGEKLMDIEDKSWDLVNKHSREITRRYSPKLTERFIQYIKPLFGKLQLTWHRAIKEYIVFGILHPTPLLFRRPLPKVEGRVNPKTREPYIELRIYADTDISVFRTISWWKKYQKILPGYLSLEKWDDDTVLKRFLHFVLRKRAGLGHKRIYEWLSEKDFTITDYQYASQEIKRFEALLKKSSKSHK